MDKTYKTPTAEQITRYKNTDTPYYTTYPPGGEWSTSYTSETMAGDLTLCRDKPAFDAALYLHIPFCEQLCYFCFCYTKIIKNKNKDVVHKTIADIIREVQMYGDYFKGPQKPKIKQLQIGGGTPTYLTTAQFDDMLSAVRNAFDLSELGEFAVEIDPRTVVPEDIIRLDEIGVNRISMGVQDLDPKVQEAINRIQPVELVERLISVKRKTTSLNFDLIYGLPHQTLKSFENTLDECIRLGVDRLSVYAYDHTPDIHAHHRMMDPAFMASKAEKIEMFLLTAEKLRQAGYRWVGVDHFAKETDSLAVAQEGKQLGRTLNGYSTFREFDCEFGIGPSAISSLPMAYVQNIKALNDYSARLAEGKFPVLRGWRLTEDDLKRREVIMHIILYANYPFKRFEDLHGVTMETYFPNFHAKLDQLVNDDLVTVSYTEMRATPLGRYFIYQIARIFDKYTEAKTEYVRTHAAVKMLSTAR